MQERILEINPTEKQYQAWLALNDQTINEIHFGGAAGGGKTWLGCESRLVRALAYPGYKSFIGRNELTRLMASSYITWTKVCSFHKLIPEKDWKFNGQYHFIEFSNGSRIDLLDLAFKPSDPMYERLGSLEFTDGWIDEAGEIPFMAVDILQSRVGRHKNKEFNLNPDTLYTYNPNKGWVYRVYKQWKEGSLPKDVVFIQSLYKDNPYTSDIYGKQLNKIKDPAMKARLMYGSFEYDDDPTCLIDYDAILDLFSNAGQQTNERYMTIDVARHGVDKTVIYLWKGFNIYAVYIYQKQDTTITSLKARELAREHFIPYSHCIADEDGIGGAVVDQNRGFRGFIANSQPFVKDISTNEKENFANLKAQCSYKLAEKVDDHEIAVKLETFHSEVNGITEEVWKEMLVEELEQIKSKDKDKDTKLKVISKEEVKEMIGRSPDFSDTMMMRMALEYRDTKKLGSKVIINRPFWAGYNKR